MSLLGESRPPALSGVLACFVLSGFAALLYETAWLRQFSVVFGTSEFATATVLAAYMGGLALGALVAGRYTDRVRRPVLVYGLLELAIALSALLVPFAIRAARGLLVLVLGEQASPPDAGGGGTALFYLASGFVILAVPAACMGATLPMLARHAVRREGEIGGRIGLLYAVNTVGAVAGTIVAAFVLIPALGLWGTILVGAAVNGIVFLIACGLSSCAALPGAGSSMPVQEAGGADEGEIPRASWVLPIMLASGAAAFAYEVLWTRLLGHVLGGSLHAFATMLASFLLGIAIGSAIAARLARRRRTAAIGLAVVQLATGVVSITIYLALDALPGVAESIGAGAHAGLGANAAAAGLVLLPATLCIGATFPFAVRVLARDERDAPRAVARVLAWNTVGAIVGAIGAGFLLIPALGFHGAVLVVVALNLVLAFGAALVPAPPSRVPAVGGVVAAVAVLGFLRPTPPEGLLRHSPLTGADESGSIVYTGVGRSAAVIVLEHAGVLSVRTNGMPEARIAPLGAPPGSEWTRLLTALPALTRPDAESVLVVGFGGGVSVSGVPPSLSVIDVIEIEPEVIAANRAIANRRREDPLADPRLRVIINDARGALALTDRRYDIIVSQPSHPWTAGASHLYTREFLELARSHLEPGGVFVQWMNSRFVDESLFATLGATLLDAFGHVHLYNPYPDMLVLLGSDEPLAVDRRFEEGAAMPPATRAHFARLGLRTSDDLAACLLLDAAGLRDLCRDAPINTDDRNRLSTHARRAARKPLGPDGMTELARPHDPLLRAGGNADGLFPDLLDPVAIVRRLLATDMYLRAVDVTAAIQDPTGKGIAESLLARAEGRGADADSILVQTLAIDPSRTDAIYALAQSRREELADDAADARVSAAVSRLTRPAAAVVESWKYARLELWTKIRLFDDAFSRARPTDACYAECVRLRALWRVRIDSGARSITLAEEAIALIDEALVPESSPRLLRLRAEAVARAAAP